MTERRTGATTLAMRNAPKGAVYIWPNSHLDYPKTLAAHLGRTDLRIERPDFLDYRLRGLTAPLVIDHAYNPNSEPISFWST